ncbi:MAG: hypothetical protein H7842_06025 [Gammaproteobacteria bacterium SHHR-1]|uniref:hypothetical protein n=1 Tax=Magnetovirga frankeli TaxID=947516 RepID=UPI001293071D|nr:hypothetical protein D5125_01185 [gamma proteobacterium SS-5]
MGNTHPLSPHIMFLTVKQAIKLLNLVAIIFFGALVVFAVPSFFDAEIEVINNSPEVVMVVAEWRNSQKEIGPLDSNSSFQFSIDDEAAVKFKVNYASGKEFATEPLYFTSGIRVIANITSDGVKVSYDYER